MHTHLEDNKILKSAVTMEQRFFINRNHHPRLCYYARCRWELMEQLLHRTRVSLLTRPHKITHWPSCELHAFEECMYYYLKKNLIKKYLKELLTGAQNWFVTRYWTHQSSSGRSIAAQIELMGAVKEPRRV
jgi:hypothetical protein